MEERHSLWGDEYLEITEEEQRLKDSAILNKIKNPKAIKKENKASSFLSFQDKLLIIKNDVYRILGKHKDDTLLITTKSHT